MNVWKLSQCKAVKATVGLITQANSRSPAWVHQTHHLASQLQHQREQQNQQELGAA